MENAFLLIIVLAIVVTQVTLVRLHSLATAMDNTKLEQKFVNVIPITQDLTATFHCALERMPQMLLFVIQREHAWDQTIVHAMLFILVKIVE
jgi:hypothetical protein